MIEILNGQTITAINIPTNGAIIAADYDGDRPDVVEFTFDNGRKLLRLYHDQECCEHVYLSQVDGDLLDLINSPILMAEKVTESVSLYDNNNIDYTYTWTFYKLATIKGYVTLTWKGRSNGYYSEEVNYKLIDL